MKNATFVLIALLMGGCSAANYLGSTEASFNKDGTWSYKSNKNQENFKAKLATDASGASSVEVETTASTPEAAIAAALQSNLEALKALNESLKLIPRK